MAQTQLFRLTHEYTFHTSRNDVANHFGLRFLALRAQDCLQFRIGIKVILNCTFIAASHKNKCVYTFGDCFLRGVLDQRLVNDWQELFGHCLCRRKETRAKPCDRENSFSNCFVHYLIKSSFLHGQKAQSTARNLKLSAGLSTCSAKQIRNRAHMCPKRVRIALALNIQPHDRLGVRAAQVEAPIHKLQAHPVSLI